MPTASNATIARHGRFQPGYDPRRHCFTREECCRGFRAAEASLSRRYPGCDAHFLMCALIGSRPWHTLPEFRRLLERDEPPSEEEICRLFAERDPALPVSCREVSA